MGRLAFLPFLGLLTIGYTAKCPESQKAHHEREILCYTSLNDMKQLENSMCKCTTLVHRGHDLQDLNTSGLQGIREALKNVNPSMQFVIGINDYQGSLRTSAVARQQAIARISTILNEVDGVELNVTAGTKERLVHFIQGLKEEMMRISKYRRILLALPTKEEPLAKEFDVGKLSKYVDLFTVPTHYLMDGDEIFKTFHPSRLMGLLDLSNTDSLVDLIHGLGADKRKILISLPASGYKFTLKDKNNNAPSAPTIDERPTTINRVEFCDMIRKGEWTIEREGDLTAPYAFNNFTWIAFEDKISTKIKGKYVLLRDLAGLAIDQIENDSKTDCGRAITEEVYHSFADNERKTREAVLNSLQKDIDNTENSYPNSVKTSEFRISRIVDNEGKIHSIRENMQTEFSCLRQGYFVHPKSCNRFYRCVKFNQKVEDYSVFEFDCPTGLSFDERTEVCVWPGSLPEGSPCPGSSEIAPTTPHRFRCPGEGYYADPHNCRWFYACINLGQHEMTPYEFSCPYGLVFDERKLVCEWPWLVPNCTAGNNYEHNGGNKKGYGGSSSGATTHLDDREYNESTGDDVSRYSHDDSSHYQYSAHSVSSDLITTTAPESVFIPTSSTENQQYITLTPISQIDYRRDGGRFTESQSTTENENAYVEVSSVNSVSELEKSSPSESAIQASNSVTIGRAPTGTSVIPINQRFNPDFLNIRGTDETSETISIGNEYYMNQAGTIGIKTQPKYYSKPVSNTFGTLRPIGNHYSNQLGINTPQFRVTNTDDITNHPFNKNPNTWLFKNTGGGEKFFPNKIPVGVNSPALSTGPLGSQYSPRQYVTPSYTPGSGTQNVFSTGATRGELPIDYTVKIPEGANGNQFFLNHASVSPVYKGNPFLPSTSLKSFGNEYHENQAGNEASTLSQPNSNGYKTNEYHDNGGRSTIRYNNGLIAHKYTDDDVRNGKIPIPALGTSLFFNQTSRPVFGISTDENGSTKSSGTPDQSNIVEANGPRSITHINQIGENAFVGTTKLAGNSKTQLNLLTPTVKPKFDSAYSSVKPSISIKTDGTLENVEMEKFTTQQPFFFDIQVDNNRARVTTSEPEMVNTIFSQSPAVQYSRPLSVSSTVRPIEYTTDRLPNVGYRIKVSSTSIPVSTNVGKYHDDNLSNVGVHSQGTTNTIIQHENIGKTFTYNGINHPDTTIPLSTTDQKQTFGEKIVRNKVDFIGSNRQNNAFVRPGTHYSPSTTLAEEVVTHSKTAKNPVNKGYSSPKFIDSSILAARRTPAKSSSIPQHNYNRGNLKYTPASDDDNVPELSEKMGEHIITTQQPAVTTYNGGYRNSLTTQSSEISRKDNRGEIVIKYSDLRPILLEKLGAECTCKSDPFTGFKSDRPLLINSSKGTIDLRNYNESDVYIDLELNKKSGGKTRLMTTTFSPRNVKYQPPTVTVFNSGIKSTIKPEKPTPTRLTQSPSDIEISASFNINRSKSRGAKNLPLNENNFPEIGLLDNAECARPGLFRHPKSCNKFYVCHWDQWKKKFTLSVSDCPVHLTFNSNAGACNWPSQGPACQVDHLLA